LIDNARKAEGSTTMTMTEALPVPVDVSADAPPALRVVTPATATAVRVADIVLVDPTGSFAPALAATLTRDGLVVTAAEPTSTALEVAVAPADLILVHTATGQPWADEAACRALRDLTVAPIVYLVDTPPLDLLVSLLDAGADELVASHTRPYELVARLRAVLRGTRRTVGPARPELHASDDVVSADGLVVDTARLEVRLDDQRVHFTAREAQLLAALLRAPGRVVARHVLLDEVWGSRSSVSTKTLEKYITAVRRRLDGHGVPPGRVAAVRGYGYRYVPAAG
jgi:two-component system response regulator MtrA